MDSLIPPIQALVVTPVKDAIDGTLETIRAVRRSNVPVQHVVYNDYGTPDTKQALERHQTELGYTLIHLEDLIDHPSPNYRTVLQDAQRRALAEQVPLIIIESDVIVNNDTLQRLLAFYGQHRPLGLVGAATIDEAGNINFPYLRFKEQLEEADGSAIETKKSLSFCCTLISPEFLKRYDFAGLDDSKHWFDTTISYQATDMGFRNYLLPTVAVLHKPHGSRPWKHLKYTNPLKYYFLKFIKRRDKI